jgi:uncharacterized protein
MLQENPCLHCGACCAHFRVSFYWSEADLAQGGTVPPELTEDLPPYFNCMKGTNQAVPHCIALEGSVGACVHCTIYDQRPTPCHDFGIHWHMGSIFAEPEKLKRCNAARAAWDLPPLTPTRPELNKTQSMLLHHRHAPLVHNNHHIHSC